MSESKTSTSNAEVKEARLARAQMYSASFFSDSDRANQALQRAIHDMLPDEFRVPPGLERETPQINAHLAERVLRSGALGPYENLTDVTGPLARTLYHVKLHFKSYQTDIGVYDGRFVSFEDTTPAEAGQYYFHEVSCLDGCAQRTVTMMRFSLASAVPEHLSNPNFTRYDCRIRSWSKPFFSGQRGSAAQKPLNTPRYEYSRSRDAGATISRPVLAYVEGVVVLIAVVGVDFRLKETQEQINSWARSLSATQQDTVLCHETNTPLIKFANGVDDKLCHDTDPKWAAAQVAGDVTRPLMNPNLDVEDCTWKVVLRDIVDPIAFIRFLTDGDSAQRATFALLVIAIIILLFSNLYPCLRHCCGGSRPPALAHPVPAADAAARAAPERVEARDAAARAECISLPNLYPCLRHCCVGSRPPALAHPVPAADAAARAAPERVEARDAAARAECTRAIDDAARERDAAVPVAADAAREPHPPVLSHDPAAVRDCVDLPRATDELVPVGAVAVAPSPALESNPAAPAAAAPRAAIAGAGTADELVPVGAVAVAPSPALEPNPAAPAAAAPRAAIAGDGTGAPQPSPPGSSLTLSPRDSAAGNFSHRRDKSAPAAAGIRKRSVAEVLRPGLGSEAHDRSRPS